MGKTNISWTDFTWNPWRGCHKVSQGCKNCYMFREQKRWGNDPNIVVRSKTTFGFPYSLTARTYPESAMIFTCSWSDFFIEDADEWRDDAWEIIRKTPHLTYQILTKRPENIRSRLPEDWGDGWDNVWLGVSIEDKENYARGLNLATIPAKIRFISAEPLLGLLDLLWLLSSKYIHWVIVGGESGPNHRPMELDWARQIKEDCEGAGVAFFMKQDSGLWPGMRGRIPDDLWIQEFPEVSGD